MKPGALKVGLLHSIIRKEEKLFPAKNLDAIRKLRRMMVDLNPIEAMETLQNACRKYKTNDELLAQLK